MHLKGWKQSPIHLKDLMVHINSIHISPPLLNSSCAWSSDFAQLKALYDSPYTGAITTRTATLSGYKENDTHTFAFTKTSISSINSFGYSPHPFPQYLAWIEELLATATKYKPIIVSITSDINDAASFTTMLDELQNLRKKLGDQTDDQHARIAVELNTSCPNIQNTSPPGYDIESLNPLLEVLCDAYAKDPTLTIGLKLPPLVHEQQFHSILDRIQSLTSQTTLDNHSVGSAISFLTCTNTLGNTLLFPDQITSSSSPSNSHFTKFALPTVLGGLAGEALHPLALGNVYRFSSLLKESNKTSSLSKIKIIGVGGITSKEARRRMEAAGADAVACATFFGKEGIKAFEILSSN